MGHHAQIAALQARIVMAEGERDASFAHDAAKYTDACARIDQFALQLWDLRLAHLREHSGAPVRG